MTAAEKQYRTTLLQVEKSYASVLLGNGSWNDFRKGVVELLRWTNAVGASKARYQALRKPVRYDGSTELSSLLQKNGFLQVQDKALSVYIRDRAAFTVAVEKRFLEERGQFLDEETLVRAARSRFTMFYRNMVADMLSLSTHTAASSGELREYFPFMMYVTMKDEAVRKTHAAMNGFVAVTNDPIWRVVRPACGYNCRCSIRLITLAEAIRHGWMAGKTPRFSQKWPPTLAKRNYLIGIFPDSGWHGPKEIARL